MRRKQEAVLCLESNDDGLPRVVRDYRERYRAISQVLDDNREILSAVHQDLVKLSDGDSQGREADYTSENILRALVVQHREGLAFREAVIRIGSDPFLQDFLRMRKRAVMDYSFLDKCFLAIRPQTWKRVNELRGRYGVTQEMVHTDVNAAHFLPIFEGGGPPAGNGRLHSVVRPWNHRGLGMSRPLCSAVPRRFLGTMANLRILRVSTEK